MYRLYTQVKVSTRFIKPRAKGTRFDKSNREDTEVYNAILSCYSNAFHSKGHHLSQQMLEIDTEFDKFCSQRTEK